MSIKMIIDGEIEANTDASGEAARLVVLTYLQKVLSAINTVLDESSHLSGSPDVLLDHIARKLLRAFSPDILTAPLPSSLSLDVSSNNDEDSDDDIDDNVPDLMKDTPIPRKHRCLDYLRCILRGMAPISFDVAALVCSSQVDLQTLILLFGTWIPLAPHLMSLVSETFAKSNTNPFDNCDDNELHQWHLLEAMHAITRHYSYHQGHSTMSQWWSWAPLYSFLKPSSDMETSGSGWFPSQATRWHAARAIGYLFDMSPGTMGTLLKRLNVHSDLVPWMLHPWILHQEEFEWESQHRQSIVKFLDDDEVPLPTSLQVRACVSLHSSLVHIGEGLVFYREPNATTSTTQSSMVLTMTTQQNLALVAAALALEEMSPILLAGPTGSGKSTLIRHLCNALGHKNLLELHVDDDTDSKTLIGSYQTTDMPGEFTWQPGALTRAVRDGTWVLLEDLDTVPIEIQAALIPLLEDRRLPLNSTGDNEICHPNFRLFATLSTSSRRHGNILSKRLWRKVRVEPLPLMEWKEIASAKYPFMPETICSAALAILEQCLGQKTAGRPAAVRDFLKLLSRISNSVVFGESNGYVTEAQRTLCLAETLDVFAAHSPDVDQTRVFASHTAAPAWGLTADLALHYLVSRRPELIQSQHVTQIGRAILPVKMVDDAKMDDGTASSFAPTNTAMRLLESISVCVRENEPTLLVGETGCGKTTILQHLAQLTDHNLIVQNLSLQTDSTDLLGGFRPLEITHIARAIYLEFVDIFVSSFSRKQNADFLNFASSAFHKNQWKKLSQCLRRAAKLGLDKVKKTNGNQKGASCEAWQRFAESAERFDRQRLACDTKLAFSFTEGALVDAIRTGKWVLLDEINLASSETLQRLCGLLDDRTGSVTLTERGDAVAISRHPDFRLFAAMNPATDAGKKDLPSSIRSRFTEIYVDELRDPVELRTIAARYLSGVVSTGGGPLEHSEVVMSVVDTFIKSRELASKSLVDASGQRPRYTLRTMCRALTASANLIVKQGLSLKRGLMEGFELAFEGPLESASLGTLKQLLHARLGHGLTKDEVNRPGRRPGGRGVTDDYVLVKPFWIKRGPFDLQDWSENEHAGRAKFILTNTMSLNLRRLSRAVAAGPWPVLLEGPTSAGKTTLIEYLAARCGHRVVRINNHEHTDVQEYTGSYASDENGSLTFRDGILVKALRKGHWVILDELNLAPSEVLEALNRLLDDNRELYLAEINETVKPHQNFRLFATQNPCGAYGGRKPLSRAFRNRFVEIHMGDIPADDMVTILEQRCGCPSTHAKLLVNIMTSLRQRRSKHGVFLGKDGLITPRDLLRWAERRASTKVELAQEGFMLLGERLRSEAEREAVRDEIEKHLKVSICCEEIYYGENSLARRVFEKAMVAEPMSLDMHGVAPTRTMLRLLSLVLRCIKQREPILLVGDTGCGKTTVVQLLSTILQRKLKIVNCHATTETSDLIGGLRPVRGRQNILVDMCNKFREFGQCIESESEITEKEIADVLATIDSEVSLPDDFPTRIIAITRVLWREHCDKTGEKGRKKRKLDCGNSQSDCKIDGEISDEQGCVELVVRELERLHRSYSSLFEWVDGSLVQSMRSGDLFLLDEMSLAEDAVLERLNSVLETSRTIVLAEKGDDGCEQDDHVVKGHDDFLIFATMNPGGDYGKRELSPALRSRFTEIWVPSVVDMEDIKMVLDTTFKRMDNCFDTELVKRVILDYIEWFNTAICGDPSSPCSGLVLSLRDVITWARFVTEVSAENEGMSVWEALCHGSSLMHLDGLGLGTGLSRDDAEATRRRALSFLLGSIPTEHQENCQVSIQSRTLKPVAMLDRFGICPFSIPFGSQPRPEQSFNFRAPTTGSNLLRVLRAMQLLKPVLLEGSPGVGKTSLVSALAQAAGYRLVRINLSEQTDISDLMGSDLPLPDDEDPENAKGPAFKWCDGVLLRAIKRGDWVLLDEMNLASQSVLEGLNSCLDHRANVYIPELGETFQCPASFRVFAAQNPLGQGGGRKGLPKSFLNRFTKVYVEALNDQDLAMIVGSSFSNIAPNVRAAMVGFNSAINNSIVTKREYGDAGSPWEFNLRDVFRWCELAERLESQDILSFGSCARDLYLQRFRTSGDRQKISMQFLDFFESDCISLQPEDSVYDEKSVRIGSTSIDRRLQNDDAKPQIGANFTLLRASLLPLEAVTRCVIMNWPCLLVGQPGTGKTSLLRSLASHLNVKLVDVCLTPSTDVNELLGSFEQVDSLQDEKLLLRTLEVCLRHLSCNITDSSAELDVAAKACSIYEEVSTIDSGDTSSASRGRLIVHATAFVQLMRKSALRNNSCVLQAEILLQRLSDSERSGGQRGGRFRWVDGILVDAMIKGYWLHLENVNLCSSSVLDRLNPIMEPGGELLLTETGTQGSEDSHRSMKPHPDFRLFLSMNPDRGEVSRAMRNRCVEIAILSQAEKPFFDECDTLYTDQNTVDQVDILSRNGIRTMDLVTSVLRVHQQASHSCSLAGIGAPNSDSPRLMASGIRGLRSQGHGFDNSFSLSKRMTFEVTVHNEHETSTLGGNNDHSTLQAVAMVPGMREGWALNPSSSTNLFDARMIYFQRPTFPRWLQRFQSAQNLPREVMLNEVCPRLGMFGDEWDVVQMQRLVFFLFHAVVGGQNPSFRASFLDLFSTNNASVLAFLSEKLMGMKEPRLSSRIDRWALVVLEQQGKKRAMMMDNVLIASGRTSVFDVSYLLHAGKIERSMVPCPITPIIYLLFLAIDDWSSCLDDLVFDHSDNATALKCEREIRNLLRVRDQFWIYFNKAEYVSTELSSFLHFDETRFIVHWMWFKKAMAAADLMLPLANQKLLKSRQRLDALVSSIDRILLDGDGTMDLAGDLLWKKGGHPLVPANPLKWESILQIRKSSLSSCIVLDERFNSLSQIDTAPITIDDLLTQQHPVLFLAPSYKQELLEALCMAFWSSTEELRGQISPHAGKQGDYGVLCQRVEKAGTLFAAKWKATQVDTTISTVENLMDVEVLDELRNHLCDTRDESGVSLLPLQIMENFANIQVAPLVEFWLIHQELKLVNQLSANIMSGLSSGKSKQSILSSSRRFVQVALSCSVWPVADLRPFQTLIWALDSPATDTALNCLLKCLIPTMIHASSNHIWRNTFNDLGIISPILEYPMQWSLSHSHPTKPSQRWQASVGPSRLWEHVRTDTVLKLVGPEFSAALFGHKKSHYLTLENQEAREVQSKTILRQISTFVVDLQSLEHPFEVSFLFSNVVDALAEYFPDQGSATIQKCLQRMKHLTDDDVVEVLNLLGQCKHSRFNECFHDIVEPLVHSLSSVWRTGSDHDKSHAWIFVGLLRAHLLVPQSPLDPGQKPIAKVEQLDRRLCFIRGTIAAFRVDSGLKSGNFSPLGANLDEWASEAKVAVRKRSAQEKKMVDRGPNCPPFIDLFRAVRGFWKSMLTSSVVIAIADALRSASRHHNELEAALQRESSWQTTASSFCDQLTSHFCAYEDVVLPFVVATQCIQRGMRELRDSCAATVSRRSGAEPNCLASLLRFPFQVDEHHLNRHVKAMHVLARTHETTSADAKKCGLALSLSTLSRYGLQRRAMGYLESKTAANCTSLFNGIIKSWLKHLDGLHVLDSTDDVAQERIYREQFPDHHKEFVAFIQSQEDDSCDDESDAAILSDEVAEINLTDDHISIIYQLYRELFMESSTLEINLARIRSFQISYGAAYLFRRLVPDAGMAKYMKEELGSHCFAVALSCSGRTSLRGTLVSTRYSFHSDPNPVEVRKASAPLQSLLSRTSKLLTAFPGHEVLIALGQVAEYVRKLELTSTPVGKAMTGLEVVLRKAQEWEQHASERVKLGSCLVEISQLVASWRKLELNNWSLLLDAREERFVKRARRHWVRLYSVLNGVLDESDHVETEEPSKPRFALTTPSWVWKGLSRRAPGSNVITDQKRLHDITKLLDTFILTSSIGEVQERIGLIKALTRQFAANGDMSVQTFRLLASIDSYYSQFLPLIASRQTALRGPIESKLKDEVKLAKWDEQSYYALTDSTERNHRKLMKLLREYDDVLEIPIVTLLEQSYCEGIRSADGTGAEASTRVPSANDMFPMVEHFGEDRGVEAPVYSTGSNKRYWGSAENIGINCGDFVRKMGHYHKKMMVIVKHEIHDLPCWARIGVQDSSELCTAIFNRIQSLRKEKTSRQMKQRALSDLFKALKKNGYKSTKWSVPAELREMKHLFQLPVPCASPVIPVEAAAQLHRANAYFGRTMLEVQRLWSEVHILGSKHMTTRELELMTNLSNHGLLLIAQQRSIITESLSDVSRLKTAVETLTSLSSTLPLGQKQLLVGSRDFYCAFHCAKETLCQLRLIFATIMPLADSSDVGSTMRDTISVLDDCLVVMDKGHPPKDTAVVTLNAIKSGRASVLCLQEIKEKIRRSYDVCCLKQACLPNDTFEVCLTSVERAVEIGMSWTEFNGSNSHQIDEKLVDNFLRSTSKVVESSLLVVQKVHRLRGLGGLADSSCDNNDGHVDETIWEVHRRMCQEWDNLAVEGLAEILEEMTNGLVNIHESEGVLDQHRAWLVSVAADAGTLVELVLRLSLSRLCESISFFRSASKLQYVLVRVFRTLAAKGFCSENKPEDEADGDGAGDVSEMKFEDNVEGTGMGEGDGKEDVTDQLESEEQLLGLKGDNPNESTDDGKDPKKLEEEEAKKGMEMDADFDGDMFDVPDDTKEAEGDDNDEEELEREMGNGADDNEEVVDEKMWGDSDDEDEINREEEKFEKDSKTKGERIDEEMRTKEDDEEESKTEGGKSEPQAQSKEETPPTDGTDEREPDINEDLEENYEEKHHGVDVRAEEDAKGDEDDDMDLGDELNLNDDMEGSQDDGTDTDPADAASPDDEHEEGSDEAVEDKPEIEDETDSNQEQDALDTGCVHDGAAVEPSEENPDDEEPQGPRVNQPAEEKSQQEAFGVRSQDGNDNVKEHGDEGDEENAQEGQKENENAGKGDDEKPKDPSLGSVGNQGSGGQREEGFGANEISSSQPDAPNPFKNPGDATNFWHKKLRMVESGLDNPEEEVVARDDSDDDAAKKNEGEFEYTNENEASTSQVLGEASEENITPFDEIREDHEDERAEEDKTVNEQHAQQQEEAPSRKTSRPTPSSTSREQDQCDEEEEILEDEPDAQDALSDTGNPHEADMMDHELVEARGNQVVSDLTQFHIDDDGVMLDEGKIVEEEQTTGISSAEAAASRLRWNTIAGETHNLARRLCEKLRLVMEPLLATKLKGDYRTGKRINMKKVIGYIASGYRKDKIWLRRTKPAKRNYRVLLAVDNSESMYKSGAGDMALAAMATLAVGMSQLEIGELGIASFGDEMRLLHPFHLPFTSESGSGIVHKFPFDEKRTRTALCVESALAAMDVPGDHAAMQLVFMISDGRIERDSRAGLRRLMREMVERNILLVMIVVEGNQIDKKKRDSIVHMKEVSFENGKPKVKQFIEDYPFPYYIILDDMESLPEVLGDALRQWFEMIAQLQQTR